MRVSEKSENTVKAMSEVEADIAETVRAKTTMKSEGRKVRKRDKNRSKTKSNVR